MADLSWHPWRIVSETSLFYIPPLGSGGTDSVKWGSWGRSETEGTSILKKEEKKLKWSLCLMAAAILVWDWKALWWTLPSTQGSNSKLHVNSRSTVQIWWQELQSRCILAWYLRYSNRNLNQTNQSTTTVKTRNVLKKVSAPFRYTFSVSALKETGSQEETERIREGGETGICSFLFDLAKLQKLYRLEHSFSSQMLQTRRTHCQWNGKEIRSLFCETWTFLCVLLILDGKALW